MKESVFTPLVLMFLFINYAVPAQSEPISLTAIRVWPNERTSNNLPYNAIDGGISSFTWSTETWNTNPAYIAVSFGQTMEVDRIRIIKDTDRTGYDPPTYTKKNLEILYTTDEGDLELRTWVRVTGLASGLEGTEIFQADSVDADGFVWGDKHDSVHEGHGWGSLVFDPVAATGIAIHFETPDEWSVWEHYKLHELEVHGGTITGLNPVAAGKPCIHQNYPNPFAPSTTISYSVPRAGMVWLKIYDVQGRRVRTLVREANTEGTHAITWDGRTDNGVEVVSGVYFLRLESTDGFNSRAIVKLR